MKIGIISDTHGNWAAIDEALNIARGMDLWLHLGDCTPDAEYLSTTYDVPVEGVAGNCDWPNNDTCYEKVLELAGHRIFMTHGHSYSVRYTQEYVMEAAENHNADIAIFGHTHIVEYLSGPPVLLNPGSASRPRDDDRSSFMIMELVPKVAPKITIVRMKRVR